MVTNAPGPLALMHRSPKRGFLLFRWNKGNKVTLRFLYSKWQSGTDVPVHFRRATVCHAERVLFSSAQRSCLLRRDRRLIAPNTMLFSDYRDPRTRGTYFLVEGGHFLPQIGRIRPADSGVPHLVR
jgi:hypothetical protein